MRSRKLLAWVMLLSMGGAACGAVPSTVGEPRPPGATASPQGATTAAAGSAPASAPAPAATPAEPACPAVLTYPISVAVYDRKSGQPICDAEISVTSATDGRSLRVRRNVAECRTLALEGWNGEFVVKGSRSGFEPAEDHARVVETRCGYDNAQVTLWLKPVSVGGK